MDGKGIRVGFIGLGLMGLPMAKNVLAAGYPLTVFDLRSEPILELGEGGAVAADSPRELAAGSDVVISMVNDDRATDAVMLGPDGVLAGTARGAVVVLTSTLSPKYCENFALDAVKKEVNVLDAPVSGSIPGAEAGTLTLMIGGEADALERARPVLSTFSSRQFYLGPPGRGQVAKLANNIVSYINMGSCSEGLAFARANGISDERMLEIINVSTGSCWASHNWGVVEKIKNSGTTSWHNADKDLRLALAQAEEVGISLPMAAHIKRVGP